LHCRDLDVDCDAVISGETEQQVLVRAIEHGRQVHKSDQFRDMERDFLNRMVAAIRDA
jgi:predicted small metal-binding protein